VYRTRIPGPGEPNPVFPEENKIQPNSTFHFTSSDPPQNKNMTQTAQKSKGKAVFSADQTSQK